MESGLGTKTVAGIEIIEVSPQLSAVKATIEAFNKIVFPSV
jgi:arginase family enzyme